MDISLELKNIIDKKEGNKELALFCDGGLWSLDLGNPASCVSLGESSGELQTSGDSIEEAITAMKIKMGVT